MVKLRSICGRRGDDDVVRSSGGGGHGEQNRDADNERDEAHGDLQVVRPEHVDAVVRAHDARVPQGAGQEQVVRGSALHADPHARTVAVAGTLSLDAGTAGILNELFGKPQGKPSIFVAGEPMASLSFTAQGQ